MWIAWLSRRLPRRDNRQALPAAGGYLDGGGAVAGGEVIPVREAGHLADVADDRGGDDRAHPEQPGQAGPGRPTAAAAFFLISRIRASAPCRSSVSSAASSQRAASIAPAGVIDARICPAWPAVISPGTPPGASSHRFRL